MNIACDYCGKLIATAPAFVGRGRVRAIIAMKRDHEAYCK